MLYCTFTFTKGFITLIEAIFKLNKISYKVLKQQQYFINQQIISQTPIS